MGKKGNREPWEFKNAPVGEELKITVSLTLRKLTENEGIKGKLIDQLTYIQWFIFYILELEFPSSLTAPERKYIHLISQQMGFKSKSRG